MADMESEYAGTPQPPDQSAAERAAELVTQVTEAQMTGTPSTGPPAGEASTPEAAPSEAAPSEAAAPEGRRPLRRGLKSAGTALRRRGPAAPGEGTAAADETGEQQPHRGRLKSAGAVVRRSSTVAARSGAAAGRSGAAVAKRSGAAVARSGARVTKRPVRAARRGAGMSLNWLTAQVVAMAPRLGVRDAATLRAQFPGRSPEAIADALISGAARASAAVGGAIGAWAALPVLPAFPAELAAETLALVGIEIKLVAELHEIYGVPAPGNAIDRATAYLSAWAHRRGVMMGPGGIILAAGSPLARRLRRRLAGRAGRSAFSLGPMFTGAAAGAMLNSRETRRLGQEIRADLRRRALPGAQPDL